MLLSGQRRRRLGRCSRLRNLAIRTLSWLGDHVRRNGRKLYLAWRGSRYRLGCWRRQHFSDRRARLHRLGTRGALNEWRRRRTARLWRRKRYIVDRIDRVSRPDAIRRGRLWRKRLDAEFHACRFCGNWVGIQCRQWFAQRWFAALTSFGQLFLFLARALQRIQKQAHIKAAR